MAVEIIIDEWSPPPRKKYVRKPPDPAKRKAKFFLRPDGSDRRAMDAWRKTQIAPSVTGREIVMWLYEAGEQTCGLCGGPIDISIDEAHHPQAAEADHIIPRSWGLDHTWGNVRVAHGACNRARSDQFDLPVESYAMAMERALRRWSIPPSVRETYDRMLWMERMAEQEQWSIDSIARMQANPSSPSWEGHTVEEVRGWMDRHLRMMRNLRGAIGECAEVIEQAKLQSGTPRDKPIETNPQLGQYQ